MIVMRAEQTPERRRQIAMIGRAAQRPQWLDRLLARVRVFGDTEEQRIVLAYRYGRMAAKTARYRTKRMKESRLGRVNVMATE